MCSPGFPSSACWGRRDGFVYLARHPRLPRLTALKLLNRELFADAEIRARSSGRPTWPRGWTHPNIVAVYDRGVETNSCG
ncbi:hypothetical protein [Nocardia sp. BMG51109]|uniref:hypothetical protein n=1 Tax=Nocardia sp. BMG51109 TaxID=1056816 RepID=UPI0004630FC0|nr:hypothetical protein [Nocardia sp. BMG51109]